MNDGYINDKWVHRPAITTPLAVKSAEQFLSGDHLFITILESIQDGVSVLDPALEIKYVNASMKHWHTVSGGYVGRKCYSVYHNRKKPCDSCPTLACIETKEPHTSLVSYKKEGIGTGWQQLYSIPVLNGEGDVILVLEYVRDVTFQKSMENDLRNLESRFSALEDQNSILLSALGQMRHDKEEMETTIESNVEMFLKPSLEALRRRADVRDVDVISGIIDQIYSPVTKKRTVNVPPLTPREKEVAMLIKKGCSSKEIAETLFITKKAVDYHRLNIRKKLGLSRSDNLRNYLDMNL